MHSIVGQLLIDSDSGISGPSRAASINYSVLIISRSASASHATTEAPMSFGICSDRADLD